MCLRLVMETDSVRFDTMERLVGDSIGPDVVAARASLRDTLALVRREWRTHALLAAATLGPTALVQALVVFRMQIATASAQARADALGDPGLADLALTRAPYLVVAAVASVLGMLVAQGAMTHAAGAALAGRRTCLRESLRVGARSLPPLLLQHLVVSVLVVGGLLLLVVPGVVAVLAYFLVYGLAGPAVVLEGLSGVDALDRSADLTRGRKGAIALSFFPIALVLATLAAFAVGLGGYVASSIERAVGLGSALVALASTLVGALPEAVYVALATTYWTVIHARVRGGEAPSAGPSARVLA